MSDAKTGAPAVPWTSWLVVGAALTAAGFVFVRMLQQHRPGPGWLAFAAGVLAWTYLPRQLPGLRERHVLKGARKDAARLLKSVRAAMKKQRSWTGEGIRESLEAACHSLETAVAGGDVAAIRAASKNLDTLADRHVVRKGATREYVEQVGGAILAALFLRAFFYEAFRIPSASMVPTLLIGDHLFVNKFVYGLRIPFTVRKIGAKVPERGDVVVFNRPGDEEGDDIIKRVIGLPGDRVEVRDRHVTVCPGGSDCAPLLARPLGEDRLNHDGDSVAVTEHGPFQRFEQFEEQVGRHSHLMQAEDGSPQVPGYNEGSWVVQSGHVFVMGDNRDNSMDSRFGLSQGGFGQVPVDYVKGRADVIWFSLGGPYGVRFRRMFTLIP
jgi:signal peptidase I